MEKKIIDKMQALRNEGNSYPMIAELLKTTCAKVVYWCNVDRERTRSRQWFKKLPIERKKEIYKRRREYINRYIKQRYQKDKIFRDKIKGNARRYYIKSKDRSKK